MGFETAVKGTFRGCQGLLGKKKRREKGFFILFFRKKSKGVSD